MYCARHRQNVASTTWCEKKKHFRREVRKKKAGFHSQHTFTFSRNFNSKWHIISFQGAPCWWSL